MRPNKIKRDGKLVDSEAAIRLKIMRDNNDLTFDYDLRKPLSPYQKRKIKRYFDYLDDIRATASPIKRYRGADPKKKKAVARLTSGNTRLRGLNGTLYPSPAKGKLSFDKDGRAVVRVNKLKIDTHIFDQEKIAERGADYVREFIDGIPKPRKNEFLNLKFLTGGGAYEIGAARGPEVIKTLGERYFQEYRVGTLHKNGGVRTETDTPDQWLFGVRTFTHPQNDDTLLGIEKTVKDNRRKKRNEIRRLRRAENKRKKDSGN